MERQRRQMKVIRKGLDRLAEQRNGRYGERVLHGVAVKEESGRRGKLWSFEGSVCRVCTSDRFDAAGGRSTI